MASFVRTGPHEVKLVLSRVLLPGLVVALGSLAFAVPSQQALAHLGAGLEMFGSQRYSEAAKEFALALDFEPGLLNARYHLAVSYFKERQFSEARQQFERLKENGYRRRWVTYYLGRLDLQDGHPERAIHRFESLSGSQPLHDELYYLGTAFLAKGDPRRAAQSLQKEIAFNPRDFRAHYLLGRVYMSLHETSEAQRQFEESARLHKYYARGQQEIVACREELQAGRETNAWRRCCHVLQTNDIDKLVAVGTLFGEFSDYGHALETLQKALSLDPESPEINYDLGYTYYQRGDYVRAARYSHIAISQRPDFFEALEVYGMALHKLRKDAEAWPALSRAHQLRPNDAAVAEALAQIEHLMSK